MSLTSSIASLLGSDPDSSELSSKGHLGLLKDQREKLRDELRATRNTNAAQKASLSSHRRVAFRLAADIAVKRARLESYARALKDTRKAGYETAKSHEAYIAELNATIDLHEQWIKELASATRGADHSGSAASELFLGTYEPQHDS